MIARRKTGLPRRLEPQLATLVARPPRGHGWLHELKLDGYRILARLDRGQVVLFTRNGENFGALLLGAHDAAGRLVYAGRVGTGFSERFRRTLRPRLVGLERKDSAFSSPPTGAEARGVHWVKPALVAEVAFTNRTREGRLRHPTFQGLREVKRPSQVIDEQPSRKSGTRRRP